MNNGWIILIMASLFVGLGYVGVPVVIGAKGEQLKAIGSAARRDMEALFGGKIFLELWVKPRPGWPENPVELKRFGFE